MDVAAEMGLKGRLGLTVLCLRLTKPHLRPGTSRPVAVLNHIHLCGTWNAGQTCCSASHGPAAAALMLSLDLLVQVLGRQRLKDAKSRVLTRKPHLHLVLSPRC